MGLRLLLATPAFCLQPWVLAAPWAATQTSSGDPLHHVPLQLERLSDEIGKVVHAVARIADQANLSALFDRLISACRDGFHLILQSVDLS
jgi:hypothetical protein